MAPQASGDPKDLLVGGVLQCIGAATLGLPLEVMKTRQCSNPREWLFASFSAVKASGIKTFWKGLDAKLGESFMKGGVFLFSKEYLELATATAGFAKGSVVNGAVAGAGSGIAQTIVMAPLTFIVTYKVNHPEIKKSTWGIFQEVGLRGSYAGASAVAARQASNWALRQGLVNWVTGKYKDSKGGKPLSKAERIGCGLVGGALAAANQPLELLRIWMQKLKAAQGKGGNTSTGPISMGSTAKVIYAQYGFMGFWAGIIPRMGISAYHSIFMLTIAEMVKEHLSLP
jgi:hypothetical protein